MIVLTIILILIYFPALTFPFSVSNAMELFTCLYNELYKAPENMKAAPRMNQTYE